MSGRRAWVFLVGFFLTPEKCREVFMNKFLSNSSPSLTVQLRSDEQLNLFYTRHNKNNKNNNSPHQNLQEGSVLQTWNLAHRYLLSCWHLPMQHLPWWQIPPLHKYCVHVGCYSQKFTTGLFLAHSKKPRPGDNCHSDICPCNNCLHPNCNSHKWIYTNRKNKHNQMWKHIHLLSGEIQWDWNNSIPDYTSSIIWYFVLFLLLPG